MADLTITPASVLWTSGAKLSGTAGATITAGQACYYDSAAGTYKLAQCDGTAAEADAKGIALHGATAGQPLSLAGDGAVINIGATTVKTTAYLVSATAGGIAPTADIVTATHRLCDLGYATGTAGEFVVRIKNRLTQV